MAGDGNSEQEVVVLERYRLLSKLGAGGMGAVFEAEHVHLGTKHAVKALQLNVGATLSDDQQRAVEERFLREAKICASVRHPNLVSVTDFGSSGGVPYIVMDYIDGEDVQQIIDRHGALDKVSALKVTRDVAGAMGALHERGIIHRDLKPANIMVERETGRVLLTDLGIAKDTGSGANLTQGILGTPAYMAPEQMTDTSKTTPESDIYSLGVVMFAMLAGKDPFTGENPFAVLQQAREKLFAYGSMAGVAKQRDHMELDSQLESLLHDMTSYDRNKRCCKTREVVQRISTILDEVAPAAPEGHQGITMAEPSGVEGLSPAPGVGRPPTPEPSPGTADSPPSGGAGQPLAQETRNVLCALDDNEEIDEGGSKGFAIVSVLLVLTLGGVAAAGYAFKDKLFGGKPPENGGAVQPDDTGTKPPDDTGTKPPDDTGTKPPDDTGTKPPDDKGTKPPVAAFDLAKAPESLKIALADAEPVEVVLVRPGSFIVGSEDMETEEPPTKVEFTRPFYIGRFEVTVGQFAAFLNANPRARVPSDLAAAGLSRRDGKYEPVEGSARHPVGGVTHIAARDFCKWLSRESGLEVALPGEIEWEYAARGPESRIYPWGNQWDDSVACVEREAKIDVGTFPESKSWCGAEDMAGNVFEWCADAYVKARYKDIEARDPGILGAGSSSSFRAIRGGTYAHGADMCRASSRPFGFAGKGSDRSLGFRVRVAATQALLQYGAGEAGASAGPVRARRGSGQTGQASDGGPAPGAGDAGDGAKEEKK
ncbi:MAG: bifunctional serine/threonine-protein kinase/formylglycine-generating enzyme family protein [Planctomycetota bacterium]